MLAHARKKHIINKTPLNIPQRMIVNETMLVSADTRGSRKHFGKHPVSLLLMAVAVLGGWRNGGGRRKNRKEGREQGRRGGLDLL